MPKAEQPFPLPPFAGFGPKALAFFNGLDKNQTKEWFAAHKADYEREVRGPLQALVADVSRKLAKANLPLRGDPQRALFRINRDVRFAKDKRPYNTHASAALTRDGEKHSPGVLYIHIDAAESFVATGFFRPEPPTLHQLRAGLADDAKGWVKVERALAQAGLKLATDDTLARVPKGFEAAPAEIAEILKLKSWVVRKGLTPADIAGPDLVDIIVAFAKVGAPLLNFGWAALPKVRGDQQCQ